MTKLCMHCGKRLSSSEGARFCANCGTPVDSLETVRKPAEQQGGLLSPILTLMTIAAFAALVGLVFQGC